jgi:hypothetical protein
MDKFYHGKYITTQPKKNIVVPKWGGNLKSDTSTRVMYLDSSVIPNAPYVECVWFWPTDKKDEASPAPHKHEHDEVLGFFGTDPNDLNDLGAEIELYIDGERNVMNQTFVAYIPAGIIHNPLNFLKITRPVFHFATIAQKTYGGEAKK